MYFLFIAVQNRVAHAMGGETLHAASMIDVGNRARLNKIDIDIPFKTKKASSQMAAD